MFRLLIVDDEPYVVNGLVSLLKEAEVVDEIEKAYSSMQALELLSKEKFDILLTDIQMPGLNGLDLHKEVQKIWPRCKVIYLTGYNNFIYVQTAMRNEGIDYVLKTEGDKKILAAVQKAVDTLKIEMDMSHIVEQARQQMHKTLPIISKQYLSDLLAGESFSLHHLGKQFNQFEIPLSAQMPVQLMIGRIDDWHDYHYSADRSLILYSIQNIAHEYLSSCVQLYSIDYRKSTLVWFIQPEVDDWSKTNTFVMENFAQIQDTVIQLLNVQMSVSAATQAVNWLEVASKFDELHLLFDYGMGKGMMLTDELITDPSGTHPRKYIDYTSNHIVLAERLEGFFNSNRKEAFIETLQLILQTLNRSKDMDVFKHDLQIQVFYVLAAMFINLLYQSGLKEGIAGKMDLTPLTKFSIDMQWHEIHDFFYQLTEVMFSEKWEQARGNETRFIQKLHRFIEENIAGDLSLSYISGVFAFNRSYLSRLYSQLTGIGLSEYIMERRLAKSKELLKTTQLKVNDICIAVGFDAPAYYHRLFKKVMNMTPQEYRNS